MRLISQITVDGRTPFPNLFRLIPGAGKIKVGYMTSSDSNTKSAELASLFALGSQRYFAMSALSAGAGFGGAHAVNRIPPPPAGGSSGDDPKLKKHLRKILDRTSTPEKEFDLLEDAITGGEDGFHWMEMVRRAVAGDAGFSEILARPLAGKLFEMTRTVLLPRPDNYTPEERTPWGGNLIPQLKRRLVEWKRDLVVGESWEISSHSTYPNEFAVRYAGKDTTIEMGQLEAMFSNNLYGVRAPHNETASIPFLVKFVNSGGWEEFKGELGVILTELDGKREAEAWRKSLGLHSSLLELAVRDHDEIHHGISLILECVKGDYPEIAELKALHDRMLTRNLSVQVHPRADLEELAPGEHSKSEAWLILAAEEGAVIYLGLKEGVTWKKFSDTLKQGGDITKFLNAVPVTADDVFFIPAGTIHAIGAGVLLVEPQEPSETTYRVYDYNRLDRNGRRRKLDIDRAVAVTHWSGLRGARAVSSFCRMPVVSASDGINAHIVERLIDEEVFRVNRLLIAKGEPFNAEGGDFTTYTVTEGAVYVIRTGDDSPVGEFVQGRSFMIPAAMGGYRIVGKAARSVLIETTTR